MKIPERVKIGHKNFKVKLSDKLLYVMGKPIYGKIDNDICEVEIDIGREDTGGIKSEDQNNCTFIHEILHGLDVFLDIGLKENQIEKLGKGLCLFIQDNPEVFKGEVKSTNEQS